MLSYAFSLFYEVNFILSFVLCDFLFYLTINLCFPPIFVLTKKPIWSVFKVISFDFGVFPKII